MAMTFGNIAKVATTAALAGVQAQSGSSNNLVIGAKTKEENQILAITKVVEANTIGPKDKDGSGLLVRNREKMGLSKETYNQLGQLGQMTAMKRAGASLPNLLSTKV